LRKIDSYGEAKVRQGLDYIQGHWEMVTEFRLLKEIVKRREVTMKQLRELVPRRFGDHRDYYEIAGLLC
jgi:hypothetical protein